MNKSLPKGVHKELPKRSADDFMRRFVVDCPHCQGIGDRCCKERGTVIIEVDEDQVDEEAD